MLAARVSGVSGVCFSWDYLYDEVGFNQISVHMPGLNINTWIQQQQPIEGLRIEGPRTLPVSRYSRLEVHVHVHVCWQLFVISAL